MKDENHRMTVMECLGVYGQTDLTSISPWFNSSMGWAPEWYPAFDDVTDESYNADPEAYRIRVAKKNSDYIEQLKREGKYLKPFVTKISMMHNPLFDKPTYPEPRPMESYRMVFLDAGSGSGAGIIEQAQNKEPYGNLTKEMFDEKFKEALHSQVPPLRAPGNDDQVVKLKTRGIMLTATQAQKGVADGTLAPEQDKQVIQIKDKDGKLMAWMDMQEFDFHQRWGKARAEIVGPRLFGYKLTEEEENAVYIKHGIPIPEKTPPRLGHFFMAHVGESSKMLWQEPDGKVYGFKDGATCPAVEEVDTKEFTEPWTYWRAVSSFDF